MRAVQVLRTIGYAAGYFGFWAWVASMVRGLDPVIGLAIPPAARPFGLVLGVAGVVLALTCAFWFAIAGRGTPAPFDAPRVFVATGPYRFVRNPMYLGFAAGMLGVGTFIGSAGVALFAFVFLLIMHTFVVLYEEPTLERRFGESYRLYRSRVRRWLPMA